MLEVSHVNLLWLYSKALLHCQMQQAVAKKVQKSWYRFRNSIISRSLSQFIQSKNSQKAIDLSFYTTNLLIPTITKLPFDNS